MVNESERLARLRKMLEQVDPAGTGTGGGFTESLESASGAGAGGGFELDVASASPMATAEAEIATESLDLLVQGREIDKEHQFALEAIVMPFHRPVVDIVNNQMTVSQLSQKWRHIGQDDEVKSRIEATFHSIGRIEIPHHPSLPYAGTGFVVGENLLMTNRHVAEIFASGWGTRQLRFRPGQTAGVDFLRETGTTGSDMVTVNNVIMIHPYWDMALLEVTGLPIGRPPLQLSTVDPANLKDQEVVVVGYPGYDPTGDAEYQQTQNRIFRSTYYVKRLQPGQLRDREPVDSFDRMVPAITHDSSTLGGNSGSAVVELATGNVIGLHFAGAYMHANYAVPTYDLASDSRVVNEGVSFVGGADLHDDFYRPFWSEADTERPANGNVSPGSMTQSPAAVSTPVIKTSDGSATWTIPLVVSVQVGTPQQTAIPPAAVSVDEGLFGGGPSFTPAELAAMFSRSALSDTEFNWPTALSLAIASKVAYDDRVAVVSTARHAWGFDTCRFIEASDTECFVATSPEVVLIAFRGTAGVADWLTDLRIFSSERSYGSVHRGFLNGFAFVRNQLEEELQGLSGQTVLITGHSLGGALATVAAAEWQGSIPIDGIYTYGQPAVGKGNFFPFIQQHYSGRFFRFVNDDDIVTRVPPTYDHVGRLFHFDSRGRLKAQSESPGAFAQTETMSAQQFEILRAQLSAMRTQTESLEAPVPEGLLPSFRDHGLDRYIKKISDME